jgi:hypothetical protein
MRGNHKHKFVYLLVGRAVRIISYLALCERSISTNYSTYMGVVVVVGWKDL